MRASKINILLKEILMEFKQSCSSKLVLVLWSSLFVSGITSVFSNEVTNEIHSSTPISILQESANPYVLDLNEEEQKNAKSVLSGSFMPPSEVETSKFIQQEGLDLTTKSSTESWGNVPSRIGLSIDGGGIRGVMPALWLQTLKAAYEDEGEDGINAPFWKIFDYVGGTSIGGIISLGIAAELTPDAIVKMFETQRNQIFSLEGRSLLQYLDFFGLYGHRYSATKLEGLLKLEENFGEDKRLSDLKTNILVTACTNDGHPWLFKKEEKHGEKDYKLWEVARSTSAAPTYFDAYQPQFPIQSHRPHLVDGGIWANNPSTLITASIVKEFHNGKFNPNKIHLLSLGTGDTNTPAIWQSAGKLSAGAIIEALMSSHNRGNHMLMDQLLGDNYHRINAEMTQAIDLADISGGAYVKMEEYAGKKEHNEKIVGFVNQTATIIRKKLEND